MEHFYLMHVSELTDSVCLLPSVPSSYGVYLLPYSVGLLPSVQVLIASDVGKTDHTQSMFFCQKNLDW